MTFGTWPAVQSCISQLVTCVQQSIPTKSFCFFRRIYFLNALYNFVAFSVRVRTPHQAERTNERTKRFGHPSIGQPNFVWWLSSPKSLYLLWSVYSLLWLTKRSKWPQRCGCDETSRWCQNISWQLLQKLALTLNKGVYQSGSHNHVFSCCSISLRGGLFDCHFPCKIVRIPPQDFTGEIRIFLQVFLQPNGPSDDINDSKKWHHQ